MDEFKSRRAKLAQQLTNDSVAILFAAPQQYRNSDTEYFYRQSSDFFYLTGFAEPDAALVLIKDAKGHVQFILFNRPNDPDAEVWNGKRAGQQGACSDFGADEAFAIATINTVMPDLLLNRKHIYYPFGANPKFDADVHVWIKEAKRNFELKARSEPQSVSHIPDTLIDLLPLIHAARLFKSPQEIEYMRKAAEISAAAHKRLLDACKPGMLEYQLEAIFNEYCLTHGCRSLAYNSIVASGNNSCTLHYVANDQEIKNGDLVLVDAGGEYQSYAADITRTFPANGKFTAEQRQIYSLVLRAQLAGIDQVKPGNKWDSVQEVMVKIIVTGLVELGILKGDVHKLIESKAYRQFYMHSSGHWLGMDVHDVGAYKIAGAWRKFEPGMVLTVEPGIYIHNSTKNVESKWLGIGVRIEDDVLVTSKGNDVLSNIAPKQLTEIERAV